METRHEHLPRRLRERMPMDELGEGLRQQIEGEKPPNLWMTWLFTAVVVTLAVALFYLAVTW